MPEGVVAGCSKATSNLTTDLEPFRWFRELQLCHSVDVGAVETHAWCHDVMIRVPCVHGPLLATSPTGIEPPC